MLTLIASSFAAPTVLQTGEFHAAEVRPETEGAWWGLFPDGEGWTLRPTEVRVSDHQAELSLTRTVQVDAELQPLLLLRDLPLVEGPVQTATAGPTYLSPGEELVGLSATGRAQTEIVGGF